MAKVLIILTSHTQLGNTGRATGFYFDEMAAPYYALVDVGHDVDIASIKGGAAAHDPGSVKADPAERPAAVQRFLTDPAAMEKLSATHPIAAVDPARYDAVFLPGGHGTMYDFPTSEALAAVVGRVHDQGGVIAAVCHGPAGLVNAKRADGQPLVAGLRVNSFTDAEEAAVGLTDAMPFLLESRLKALGASFEGAANFTAKAVRDGRLITGQNPMSAEAVAGLLVEALAEQARRAA
ncbi:type 1 glutamine amidotransferase domain-containing protein [Bosea sp. (in: a-proteobacteria)]|uniref:type 1 glutamine amidotransferase domain-containing protein n=1 Tax=Bosea sp. (in: a-proteobacteria) TaxID=1871050 RepID=UPI002B48137A|nr:type 1 glutamine amidotransferase domain-containing protein [Bosea sp. (in: a-proteobacteria)]WRH60130.1 MAG: type 1 glutamine amidotransferase domain-containing protein [Bosea sp. (in: a-proteobacteria)]